MTDEKTIKDEWISKDEVVLRVREAGGSISLTKVSRLQEKGRLVWKVIEGKNYYDPESVNRLALELAHEADLPEVKQREATNLFMLDTTKAMLALVRDPREKIDELLFKIIGFLEERVKMLETKLDQQREATEKALDKNSERDMAMESLKSENRIKEMAAGRFVETFKKLVESWNGSKGGIQFTPDQLEMLITANKDGEEPFMTKEQVALAEKSIAEHKAKTNGKGIVEGVKKMAEASVGAVTP